MKFEVKFYKKGNHNPIMDFVLSLDEQTQLDILALFRRMEENPFTLGSLSKKIKGIKGLFELRIKGKKKRRSKRQIGKKIQYYCWRCRFLFRIC